MEIINKIIDKYKMSKRTTFAFKDGRICDLSDFEGRVYLPNSRNFTQVKFLN